MPAASASALPPPDTPQAQALRRWLDEPEPAGELVSLHCLGSSYDLARADLRRIVALPLRGRRLLTSQALVLTLEPGAPVAPALERLVELVRGRPLLGYYLDYGLSLIERALRPLLGQGLPNRRIEVSSLYYDRTLRVFSNKAVDLRLESILRDLQLPPRVPDQPLADAVAQALIYLKLTGGDAG